MPQWSCLRCSLGIDIFRPTVRELFPHGFKIFARPGQLVRSACEHHPRSQLAVKKLLPSLMEQYLYEIPESLLRPVRIVSDLFLDPVLTLALAHADQMRFPEGRINRAINFVSVFVSEREDIVAVAASTPNQIAERNLIAKVRKNGGEDSLRNGKVFTVGVGRTGRIAIARDASGGCFGCDTFEKNQSISFYEFYDDGFRRVRKVDGAKYFDDSRLSPRYWSTLSNEDGRVTNPFYYDRVVRKR